MSNTTAALDASQIIAPCITFPLANGKTLTGRLEHFRATKSLAIFDDEGLAPSLLTVPRNDAPAEHGALEPDEVLLRNWTDMRGTAEALATLGLVELTGQEVSVGMFRLQALVARVL